MSTPIINTLPEIWDATITYGKYDEVRYDNIIFISLINDNRNNNPFNTEGTCWKAHDIYKKILTVMPHNQYSGDDSFWDKDQIYIDVNGDVYVNNENTGINVSGQTHLSQNDRNLIVQQILENLGSDFKGDKGDPGANGIDGRDGVDGTVEFDELTPAQVDSLRGDTGKSAYQSWLDQGYTGTEQDFVTWLQMGIITLDNELSTTSNNGITNSAITNAFLNFKATLMGVVDTLMDEIETLKNRLSCNDVQFKFGVTTEGKYGYYIDGTDTIIPFANQDEIAALTSQSAELNAPGVFYPNIGYGEVNVMTTDIESQLTAPTSLGGEVSGTEEDPNILMASSVIPQNVNEALDLKRYIYQNNKFKSGYTYNLYNMNNTTIGLYSNNEEDIEGIWFTPDGPSVAGTYMNIVVEPVVNGTTINYQIGHYTNTEGQLPDLVDPGTLSIDDETGTFNTRTTITYTSDNTKGLYFASTQQAAYRIVEIYLE